jgi:hypothetical protein
LLRAIGIVQLLEMVGKIEVASGVSASFCAPVADLSSPTVPRADRPFTVLLILQFLAAQDLLVLERRSSVGIKSRERIVRLRIVGLRDSP